MLDRLPPDQIFSELVIAQIRTYHERCLAYYRGWSLLYVHRALLTRIASALVTRAQLNVAAERILKRSAALVEDESMRNMVKRVFEATDRELDNLSERVSAPCI